ncbi:LicD family protein [Methanobrevibacter sp.]|uniref:LicD family protein n=1 Tax=Methanobrevibacter sp. TaxID=66852 RepID=UPI002E7A86F0|nr:LicD family protein [Methanobrevibacter sp.]MEE1335179.1 LicD family protein [Methanobrevibacter sp.]
MGIFNKLKQSVLNQSDTYRLYECEYKKNKKLKKDLKKTKKRVKKLEKEFKKYKKANDLIIRSYNQQLNTIFLYTDFEAQNFLKYNHLLNIELLNFAVNICEKYGLQYWLEYGALLGAVRHKGFIPWDDDIDIGMMRKDYDKFLEVLPQELENTKLDERIKVTINISHVKPIPCIQLLYQRNVPGLLAGLDISAYDFIDDITDCNKETYCEIQKVVRTKNKNGIPIYDAVKDYIERFNISYEKQDFIIPGVDGFVEAFKAYKFFIATYDQIFPLQEVKFEDQTYTAPKDVRFYLEKQYGDYLDIPPKIHTHHFRFKVLREMDDGLDIYKEQVEIVRKANETYKK